jgi:hypothetical protein
MNKSSKGIFLLALFPIVAISGCLTMAKVECANSNAAQCRQIRADGTLKDATEDAKSQRWVAAYEKYEQVAQDPDLLPQELALAQAGMCIVGGIIMNPGRPPLSRTFSLHEQLTTCDSALRQLNDLHDPNYASARETVVKVEEGLTLRFERHMTEALHKDDLVPSCTTLLDDLQRLPNPDQTLVLSCKERITAKRITEALREKDLDKAGTSLDEYRTLPNRDVQRASLWGDQLTVLRTQREKKEAEEEAVKDAEKKSQSASVIQRLTRRFASIENYSQEQFEDHILSDYRNYMGAPFFSDAKVEAAQKGGDGVLRITVANPRGSVDMDNWPTYEEINDQFAAWCGCDGITKIYVSYVGHPLDVKLSQSQGHSVVVMP